MYSGEQMIQAAIEAILVDLLIAKLQQNGITPVVRMYLGGAPDTWSDDDITGLYHEMRKISEEYARAMHWAQE